MDRTTRVDAVWDTYIETSLSPKLGSNGVGLHHAELGSQTRYLYPRELNGSCSSRIVKTKMSFSSSSVRNCKGSQSIHSTICWQQRLIWYSAISLQTYQICLHVDKRKLTHRWYAPLAPCCWSGWYKGVPQDGRQWCCSVRHPLPPWPRTLRALDWIWIRKNIQRHSNPPYLRNVGTATLSSSALLPCFHRLWHDGNRQEDCMECVGKLSWGHHHIHCHHSRPSQSDAWFSPCETSGALAVLMYSQNCAAQSVNEARKLMFTHGLKSLDSIPPTQNALFQHAKQALHTAGFVWKQSFSRIPEIPNPGDWGWEWNARTNQWVPYWTDCQTSARLAHCSSNAGVVACKGNCKCHRAGLHCSPLCKCEGGCTNNESEMWCSCNFAFLFWWCIQLKRHVFFA